MNFQTLRYRGVTSDNLSFKMDFSNIGVQKKKINISKILGVGIATVMAIAMIVLYLLKVPNFSDNGTLSFVLGLAVVLGVMPFFADMLAASQKEKSVDTMFLEFTRDLVEGVKSGTPISKSIINVRDKNYGGLSPFVQKLANQIALGIPVKDALDTFAKDIQSPVISRAISLIREAERSGGRIEVILESVTFSVAQIEKLKKERKAAIYNLTVQGYIIFFIFIIIMLIMQFKILPMTSNLQLDSGLGDATGLSASGLPGMGGGAAVDPKSFTQPFLYLLLAQGFFCGLVIGKISEGTVKGGLKHSFILVATSWLVSYGARIVLHY